MGFFDEVLPRVDRHASPETQTVQPAHLGPPQGWVLPTVLPAVRILARSDNARIALVGVRCWPDGVSLDLHLMRRRLLHAVPDEWGVRFGVLTSDGRRTAAREFPPGPRPVPTPDGSELVLRPIFGGGGRFHRRWEFYLWPLPPKGRLTMVADWPAESIPESYTELDAGEIRSAAARAVVQWRDLPHEDVLRAGRNGNS